MKFRTDSPKISIMWEYSVGNTYDNMSMINVRGLDLYVHYEGYWQYVGTGRPRKGTPYKAVFEMDNLKEGIYEYMLYLSMYDGVKDLSIGVNSDCSITKSELNSPQREKAVVMYGTSILQGGSSSRPGLASTNLLARELDRNIVNLGFSGNALLDMEIADLMAKYPDPGVFVLDNIPNGNPSLTREKEAAFFRILRQAHPDVPVIFIENPIYPNVKFSKKGRNTVLEKNRAIQDVYDSLVSAGEKNIYYIKGENLMNDDGEGTIDGIHFTDISYRKYVETLLPVIKKALAKSFRLK